LLINVHRTVFQLYSGGPPWSDQISDYHHWSCEFELRSWRGVLETTICDKVCQWLAAGQWFSPGTPVSSYNKTDCHNI